MMHEPGIKEDAKNLSVIAGSAGLAALLTLALLAGNSNAAPEPIVRELQPVVVEVSVERPAPAAEPAVPAAPLSGLDRLYGTVHTVYGSSFTGYIRWDKNEGSWTDLLDATKPRARGGSSISGVRFGHIDRLDVISRNAALLTLRSGDRVELGAHASDLGSGLRALLVDEGDGNVAELTWGDIESVDFEAAPSTPPSEARLYGTLTTRAGHAFTGYVTWDIDEIYTTDILDGDADGRRMRIAFGDIESIERYASWGSNVTLRSGERLLLEGTNDVDASIGGIEVSDATLGAVKLDWSEFANVRFHEPSSDVSIANLDGGSELRGTVATIDGQRYSGEIVWDADERYSWEMLNGEMDGLDLHVEFAQIEQIDRSSRGAVVTLRDGRSFELSGSNDVDDGNRGITIRTDGREFEVGWHDFASLRFDR